ncbi:PREDICTED: high mobility group B protein 13-like [Ipomoea nil]|uniref:high mobility group B protein 13-like n=1 Tax=Ipomoea nil TaxID=35883 RepID=UPI0009008E32|nr:PREDICTED: high mobility group B protein 13-like [Ipomoea nil]
MADIAAADAIPAKKGKSRKALKNQKASSSEANIMAAASVSDAAIPAGESAEKENREGLCQKNSKKGASKVNKQTEELSSFEKEIQEMQEKLQQLKIEKEHTEELLKAKEEMLIQKEKEQEKLQTELKKLQKIKEFKPNLNFPIIKGDKDQEKKGKKGNDPAKKKPATAYLLWCKDQWNEVKKENPNAEFKEISNMLAAKWKTISADEKKPYEEKYQSEKEVYLKIVGNEKREQEALRLLDEEEKQKTAMDLLDQYIQFQQESESENKKKKKEKDPLKPKHPVSAFFLFSNDRRAALLAENKIAKEVAKIAGEEWRNMTDEQKAPYEEVAMKNKEQYAKEIEIYRQIKEEEAASRKKEEDEMDKLRKHEAMQLLKKKEKTDNLIKKTKEEQKKKQKEEKTTDPNRPKKPATSYLLFGKEERKKIAEEKPGSNNSTVTALISVKWKEMSEEDKQVWNNMAAEAMEAYKKELEEYNKAKEQNNNNN